MASDTSSSLAVLTSDSRVTGRSELAIVEGSDFDAGREKWITHGEGQELGLDGELRMVLLTQPVTRRAGFVRESDDAYRQRSMFAAPDVLAIQVVRDDVRTAANAGKVEITYSPRVGGGIQADVSVELLELAMRDEGYDAIVLALEANLVGRGVGSVRMSSDQVGVRAAMWRNGFDVEAKQMFTRALVDSIGRAAVSTSLPYAKRARACVEMLSASHDPNVVSSLELANQAERSVFTDSARQLADQLNALALGDVKDDGLSEPFVVRDVTFSFSRGGAPSEMTAPSVVRNPALDDAAFARVMRRLSQVSTQDIAALHVDVNDDAEKVITLDVGQAFVDSIVAGGVKQLDQPSSAAPFNEVAASTYPTALERRILVSGAA
jgi:hypothetical protein